MCTHAHDTTLYVCIHMCALFMLVPVSFVNILDMFALVKSENTSLLMLGTYLELQWMPCVLEVVGVALCVTQISIPVKSICCDGLP